MLKIALPCGKSLEAGTLALFNQALITVERKGSSAHSVRFPNYADLREGKFVKPRRAPALVESGAYDVAITGLDAVLESGSDVEVCAKLNYGRNSIGATRGVLFVSREDEVSSIVDIPKGSTILSEYPNLTRSFLAKQGIEGLSVLESSGSVEAEVPDQYRFGVCLTETGRSLKENNLKEIATLFTSSTVLIANKKALKSSKKAEAIKSLKLILLGTLEADEYKLLTMNVPVVARERVIGLLPSMNAPTIAPLVGMSSFVSVSTVVKKDEVNTFIPKLLKLGAEGLLVTSISSLIRRW